jgi:hypothetical protein
MCARRDGPGDVASRSSEPESGLVFFRFDRDGFQIFSFEDLSAIEAFNVIDSVAAGDHHCSLVFAGGLHKFSSLGIRIILAIPEVVSSGETTQADDSASSDKR